MPQDWAKANELYLKAGELGYADAYKNLGNSHLDGEGVEIDKKKAKQYYELSAVKGCASARYNLGYVESETGNQQRAKKHYLLAARAGLCKALDMVKTGFMNGAVTKEEYLHALRAYQKRNDEMKSEAWDKALAADT